MFTSVLSLTFVQYFIVVFIYYLDDRTFVVDYKEKVNRTIEIHRSVTLFTGDLDKAELAADRNTLYCFERDFAFIGENRHLKNCRQQVA